MKISQTEPLKINGLDHINSHVSYLLTCDSKAKEDINGYAKSNIIAYYKNQELLIVNGYELKQRESLAKKVRKMARDSLTSLKDRSIQSKMRMQLTYIEGLTNYNLNNEDGFNDMVEFITDYIESNELESKMAGETSFLYVFHLHQKDCPHIHRFYRIK